MSKGDPKWNVLLDRLADWIVILTGLAVLAMTLMISFDALMRYFLDQPQLFVDELTSFLLVGVVFLGTAPTFRKGGHIRVDLITNCLTPSTQSKLRVLTLFIGIALLGIIVYETLRSAAVAYEMGRLSAVMLYPLWIAMIFIPLGLALMAFFMAMKLREEMRSRRPGASKSGPENPRKIAH